MKITKFCLIVLVSAAFSAATSSHAASLIWTNGNGNFNDGSKWSTGTAPVAGDDTDFTNSTSYTVTLTASTPLTRTNAFDAKSGTVTINASGFTWSASDMFSIGHNGNATGTVVLAGGTLTSSSALRVGDSGISLGVLTISNGTVNAGTVTLGFSFGSSGTLVASGAGATVSSSSLFFIGNNGAANCNLTVNNGAHFSSQFTYVGNGGASSNVFNFGGVGAATTANAGSLEIGYGPGFANVMTVTNATLTVNSGTIGDGNAAGACGNSNTLSILNGGTVNVLGYYFRVCSFATGNVMVVNGGVLNNANAGTGFDTLRIGVSAGAGVAYGNSVIVSNGGKIFCSRILVGDGNNVTSGSNNVLQVGGFGLPSLVSALGNTVTVGNGGANGESLIITNGSLFNNSGPTIGYGTSNNTCLVLAGGLFDTGNTAIQIGYNNGGAFQTAGNVLTLGAGGVITNVSSIGVNANNSMNILGGTVNMVTGTKNVNDAGTLTGVGTISPGSVTVMAGGTFIPGNPVGTLLIAEDLTNQTGSTTVFHLGSSSALVTVGTNLTLDGTLNVVDSGGLANGTYTLYTYGGVGKINPGFTLGSLPGTFSGVISNDTPNGRILLVLTGGAVSDPFTSWQTHYFPGGGANAAPGADPDHDGMSNTNEFLASFNPTNSAAYLHVINIAKTNNDIQVTYLGANGDNTWSPGIASRTNVLEFTSGIAGGSYSSNTFVSTGITNILSGGTGAGVVTNMVDVGGATNLPSRYYRVRVLLP